MEVLGPDIRGDLRENLGFICQPGHKELFILLDPVLFGRFAAAVPALFLCGSCRLSAVIPDSLCRSGPSVRSYQPFQASFVDIVAPCRFPEIIVSLDLIFDRAQFGGNGVMELRSLGRVVHRVLPLHHAKLEEKAVLGISDPLKKRVLPVRLDKFIGILLRTQVDHFSFNPGLFQDADTSERCPYTGSVAVISEQDLLCISL